jgi:subtilisin family serine protease
VKKWLSPLLLLALFNSCGTNGSSSKTTSDFRANFNPYNEPYFPYQWYLAYTKNDFTQTIQVDPNAGIHIIDAWKETRGKGVKVAVIDSNFEVTHPDLEENIYTYYNADAKNSNVANDTDDSSHGTTAAGFIAAVPNGYGILGTAPDSELILIRQIYADDAATIRAFEYAKEKGAKVISNSWGTGDVSEAVAVELENLKKEGITIFFASGNNGPTPHNNDKDLDQPGVNDESELSSVIGVGATNEYNRLASYSNYGENIDILAPGGVEIGLLGLDDMGEKGVYYSSYQFSNGYVLQLDNAHAFEIGTSFACPLAAGVAALMLSVNPTLTPDQIREIMISTADKIESDYVYYDENGFNLKRAYGKLNASKAVAAAKNYHPSAVVKN